MSDLQHSPAEVPAEFERHRAFVRETDKALATVYGVGGAGVLGAGAAVLVVAWLLGAFGTVAAWVLSVTVMLVALFVLRGIVNRRRAVLEDRIRQYCEINGIDRSQFVHHYALEGIYPYFLSLVTPRQRA